MAQENPSVTRFREYIRIKSVQPDPDYSLVFDLQNSCIEWVQEQAKEIGLEFDLIHFELQPGFAVVLTWKGSNPDLQALMLNSHMDVVPVNSSKWSHDPFAAIKDDNGKIFGRGTQDMKSVGVQHMEAVRNLKAQGYSPQRTVHITFVPDEEIGGTNGMAKFVETTEFKKLNVGFELDEGGPCPTEQFGLFYGERALWQIKITIKGNTGHALNFVEGTSVEKLQKLMNGFLTLREKEKEKLSDGDVSRLGLVTTINITMINGGLQPNVIPPELTAVVDMRVTPNGWTEEKAEEIIEKIIEESGSDITYEFINRNPLIPETPINDENPWWRCFKRTCDELEMKLLPMICPGATDARFLRSKGIPAFGFSPMNYTPMLLHDNDEYLEEKIFLKGIDIFTKLVRNLTEESL